MTPERLSAERLAEIRQLYPDDEIVRVLFAELDAVSRERELLQGDTESLRHEIELFRVAVATLTRERDEALRERDRLRAMFTAAAAWSAATAKKDA